MPSAPWLKDALDGGSIPASSTRARRAPRCLAAAALLPAAAKLMIVACSPHRTSAIHRHAPGSARRSTPTSPLVRSLARPPFLLLPTRTLVRGRHRPYAILTPTRMFVHAAITTPSPPLSPLLALYPHRPPSGPERARCSMTLRLGHFGIRCRQGYIQ